jgi:hypothetical protein
MLVPLMEPITAQRLQASLFIAAVIGAGGAGAAELTFEKDVRPILKAQCFHCHGEAGETKGGLDSRLARFLFKGGKSGPAVVPGDAAGSHLVQLIRSGEMPEGTGKLTSGEVEMIERWVTQGAKTQRPEPEMLGPEHAFTDEDRAWWAFQPIVRPQVPVVKDAGMMVRNPIDAFVAAKLEEKGLRQSPEAAPLTLLRRVSFDLTGLPPTEEEVSKPGIHDAMVDRLLNSPHYGERWARHWLDVAGYADSDGYSEKDPERPHAWKYRDYVISAFNRDKPFDVFVREQLAGDEIALKEGLTADAPTPEGRARYGELLRATGFLRMAPDGTGVENTLITQNDCIANTIKIVSTALYGMTIGCAQCHDHRYDPITHDDYHRLRAVFEPALNPKAWLSPAGRLVSIQTKEQAAEAARIEAGAKKLDGARIVQQEAFISEVLEKELGKAAEADHEALRAAYRAAVQARKPEQVALLKKYPRVNQLSAGSLYLYDTTYKTKHADTLKKMAAAAAVVRERKPQPDVVQALTEKPGAAVPVTFLFHRGQPDQPKHPVKPGDLTVLAGLREVDIPEKRSDLPTSGRRLAFAESITDGKHPLLARVMVNRVWMQHFGRGLVASVGDFGVLGEKPTHPELLDWLAAEFMANGWSLKHLHRLILTSHTWRQSSLRDGEKERIDPDNLWLARMSVRRLEAETLRDGLLSVSGQLNAKVAGPPVPVSQNEGGQVVVAVDTTDTAGRQTGKIVPLNGEEYRRSVYVQARRSKPLEMFAAFDAPAMTDANCEARPVTTVSPQSLLLMNNGYMREYAQFFAARLERETPDGLEARIERAFRLCYGRAPSMAEIGGAREFVREQAEHYNAHPAKFERVVGPEPKENAPATTLALAALCHALLSSNEFLYVD